MTLEISNPMDYHVGLYIRLSKEDDNEGQSQSVSNQLSMLKTFAKERRLDIFDTYIDDGWSGTNFDRPSFKRLVSDIEAGQVNMVVTKDLSRLGRDYIMTGHYMERFFPEHRVRYISLLDGIDTGIESTANDITPFRAIMNDMYAKDISKKIKSVKHNKQRKGLFIGGKPIYGYKMHPTEKNRIVIDEEAASVVRHIFGMALTGMSCRQIAMRLNAEKVPTPATYAGLTLGRTGPYSGKWSSERISDMLQNETYVGNMVQGRSKKISYKSKQTIRQPRENWIVVKGTHEPLIGPEMFAEIQRMVNSRRTTRSRTYDFPLKGLIYCHECGYPLAVINRPNAKGDDCLYFVCRTYQRFTKAGVCTCHSIKEQTVTDAVLEKVHEICESYLKADELSPIAEQAIKEKQQESDNKKKIAGIQAKIENLTAHLDKMYMDKLSGLLDEKDFKRIYLRAKGERSALEKSLEQKKSPDYSPAKQLELAKALVKQFIEGACRSRELLTSLIERIELTDDKQVLIYFRFKQLNEINRLQ